ncbi:N-acetylmuramoyl-L-alanine amidase LytC precursor [Peptococcaceae bacterium CEB3]|nr:N-acetylmuramoyl-L-alanine amidase LytC precursor [Peptococcaceae bacterium CEB3]
MSVDKVFRQRMRGTHFLLTVMLAAVFCFSFAPRVFAATTSFDTASTAVLPGSIAGTDRIGTAIKIAQAGWPDGSQNVLVVPADRANLVDALSAAPLAGQLKAPILVTYKSGLDSRVAAEITALQATHIYAIGALSPAVVNSLKGIAGASVIPLQGASRTDTAALVAKQLTGSRGSFVVGYNGIPDALSASSYAAANGYAILIANPNGTLPSSEAPFTGAGVYVLGGPSLVADIPGATRLAGTDRYATNEKIITGLTFKYDKVYLANGETMVDALAGSSLAAQTDSPMVLVNSDTTKPIPANVSKEFTYGTQVIGLGGSGVVPASLLNLAQQAAGTVVSAAPVSVTTKAGQAPVLPATVTATMSDGTTQSVAVTWASVASSVYAAPGTFAVSGEIARSAVKAKANVVVTGSAPTLTGLPPVSIATTVGNPPVLPATLTATMSDGTTRVVAVTWSNVAPSQYASAGTFVVVGRVADSTLTATATVTVTVTSVKPVYYGSDSGTGSSPFTPDFYIGQLGYGTHEHFDPSSGGDDHSGSYFNGSGAAKATWIYGYWLVSGLSAAPKGITAAAWGQKQAQVAYQAFQDLSKYYGSKVKPVVFVDVEDCGGGLDAKDYTNNQQIYTSFVNWLRQNSTVKVGTYSSPSEWGSLTMGSNFAPLTPGYYWVADYPDVGGHPDQNALTPSNPFWVNFPQTSEQAEIWQFEGTPDYNVARVLP